MNTDKHNETAQGKPELPEIKGIDAIVDESRWQGIESAQAQHSPLPWSEEGGIITAGISPGQPYIADCRFGPLENRKANARLIITSVNNFRLLEGNRDYYKAHAEKLSEALRDLRTRVVAERPDCLNTTKADKALAAYEKEAR